MICEHCGAVVEGKYCEYCGCELPENKKEEVPHQTIINNYYINRNGAMEKINLDGLYSGQMLVSEKSRAIALILCIFFGTIGVHHFYSGRIGKGILYIFTFGLFGIGYLVDLINIARGAYKDSSGLRVKEWRLEDKGVRTAVIVIIAVVVILWLRN